MTADKTPLANVPPDADPNPAVSDPTINDVISQPNVDQPNLLDIPSVP